MQLQHYPIEKLKTELLAAVQAEVGQKKFSLFFFGSRVKGTATERADIDVGFLADKPLASAVKWRIKERIDEIPTLYKIDFIDFGSVDEDFRKLAMQKTEVIYG